MSIAQDFNAVTAENSPGQRTVPMGAYFVLTAIVALFLAIVRLSLRDDESTEALIPRTLPGLIVGSIVGTIMGGFDIPRRRGVFLGCVAGALVGAPVSASFYIPLEQLSVAVHLANASALLLLGFALWVRWNR